MTKLWPIDWKSRRRRTARQRHPVAKIKNIVSLIFFMVNNNIKNIFQNKYFKRGLDPSPKQMRILIAFGCKTFILDEYKSTHRDLIAAYRQAGSYQVAICRLTVFFSHFWLTAVK